MMHSLASSPANMTASHLHAYTAAAGHTHSCACTPLLLDTEHNNAAARAACAPCMVMLSFEQAGKQAPELLLLGCQLQGGHAGFCSSCCCGPAPCLLVFRPLLLLALQLASCTPAHAAPG